jgi:hypothetical protein
MKVRNSIKVFAVFAVGVMLMAWLFLSCDFSGPYNPGGAGSLSIGDIVDYSKGLFDFEGRRREECYKTLRACEKKLDQIAKANSDDVEILTGMADLYSGREDGEPLLTIRRKWPQYRPAMELQAWQETRALLRIAYTIQEFSRLAANADPNDNVKVDYYDVNDFMLKRDDPFIRVVDVMDSPSKSVFFVTDTAAAKKAVRERLGGEADVGIARLRELGRQDPNNALYDYLVAAGYSQRGQAIEAAASLKAATGKRLNLHSAERDTCLKKFMEKAGFSTSLQEFTFSEYQVFVNRQSFAVVDLLKQQAAEAERRGDIDGAKAMRDAAQKVVNDATKQKPAGK